MKLAPYGKPLKELLEAGKLPHNTVYLYFGDKSWDRGAASAKMRPTRTLILPPDESPLLYEWPVKGCDILMHETSKSTEGFVQAFVSILFGFGATIVRFQNLDFLLTVYEKDVQDE